MTAIEERPTGAVVSAYGLRRPASTDLRRAIDRIYGDDADALWREICTDAGISPLGDQGYDRIVDSMYRHHDGAVRLCAESFMIRSNAFEHLFNAESIVGSTQ